MVLTIWLVVVCAGCNKVWAAQLTPASWPAAWTKTYAAGGPVNLILGGGVFARRPDAGARSVDGLSWTSTPSPNYSSWLNNLGYGNGVWITTGPTGQVFTSTDLQTWSRQGTPDSDDITTPAYGNGVFVLRKYSQTGYMLTSTDRGATWSNVDTGGAPSANYNSLTFGNGKFLYALDSSVRTSTNGFTWTETAVSVPASFSFNNGGVMFDGSRFTCVATTASNGSSRTVVTGTSADGTTWTFHTATVSSSRPLITLAASQGLIVAGNSDASGSSMFVSADGAAWTDVSAAWQTVSVQSMAIEGGTIVVNAADGIYTGFSPLAAVFNSSADVPVTASSYSAAGNTVNFTLNFAPAVGTTLTVIKNTGAGFTNGAFSNLAQGQAVPLTFGGKTYNFVANYYGGDGNDLVLQWASITLVGWGKGTSSQLGNGGASNSLLPAAVNTTGVLAGKTLLSVSAGATFTLALCSDGKVASWGNNADGELGINSTTTSLVPVMVDTSEALAGKTVVAVSAGVDHCLALCSDGTTVAWGKNTYGQLGNGGTQSSLVPTPVNTTGVLAGKTVVRISAGFQHSVVLCSDGNLYSWGYNNSFGLLGNNSTAQSLMPVAVDTTGILAGRTTTGLSTGSENSIVQCSDGILAGWGYNASGELGDGNTTSSLVPAGVNMNGFLAGKTVASFACGQDCCMVLCSDGTVSTWGINSLGQLGNNSGSVSSPAGIITSGVLAAKTVIAVIPGRAHSLVLCSDGTAGSFGNNAEGELGIGSTTSNYIPSLVNTSSLASGGRFSALFSGSSGDASFGFYALPAAPVVTTTTASSVTATSATLNGVINATGSSTAVSFDYGTTTAYGTHVAGTPTPVTGSSPVTVSVNVTSLAPVTTYHYRANGVSAGGTVNADDLTFTTLSNDATLSGLTPSSGTLSPAFSPATMSYSATVANAVASMTLTATATQAGTSLTVNGLPATSGSASSAIPLAVGSNTVPIVITAPDGTTTKTYVVNLTRLNGPPVLDLPAVVAVTGTGASLGGNVLSDSGLAILSRGVVLSATAVNGSPQLGGTGVATVAASGTTGAFTVVAAGLTPGAGYSFAVFATNSQGTTYSATGSFTTLSNNASLAGLALTGGTLSPAFVGGTASYTATVPSNPPIISVIPVAAQAGATMKVNGSAVASGDVSSSIALGAGANVITVTVLAQDGITSQTYTVAVTRLALPVVTLPTVTNVTSRGAMLGGDVAGDGGATISVRGVIFSPTAINSNPQVGGFGVTTSGTTGVFTVSADGLKADTAYSFAAYATNSEGTSYSATGSFKTLSSDARLSSLVLSSGTLTPAFAAGTLSYAAAVPYASATLTVTPSTARADASLTINGLPAASGIASGAIPLNVGTNTVNIVVTAPDGATQLSYAATVTRGVPPSVSTPSSSAVTGTAATLGGTVTSDGSVAITARGVVFAPASINSSPQIGGAAVTQMTGGGTIGEFIVNATVLNPGTIYAFAAYATWSGTDGAGISYSSIGTFATLGNNASLSSLTLSRGTLSPAFAPGTTSYTVTLPSVPPVLSLTPTATQAGATIKVNNMAVASGSSSGRLALDAGANAITIAVTAPDGVTSQAYTVMVTRLAPPTVSTPTVTGIGGTSAMLGGTVDGDGGAPISVRGVVFSPLAVNSNPEIGGTGVTSSGTTGVFSVPASGLAPGITYIFAAYATNSQGTSYSPTATFTMLKNKAGLSNLGLSAGTLSPAFAGAATSYTCIVSTLTASITVTPAVSDADATVQVNGAAVASGSTSSVIPLAVGLNTLSIVVTAQDGTTAAVYTVVVTRAAAAMSVQQPAGNILALGTASTDFGGAVPGKTASRTFSLKNIGSAVLQNFVITFDGANPSDFAVTRAPAASLAAGASTTFTIAFTPPVAGIRSAGLQLAAANAVWNPFDISLTGTGAIPPAISAQPASLIVATGRPAVLTVAASGGALAYQWLKNNVPVAGATGSSIALAAASTSNAGTYTVKISNAAGAVTSQAANLGVVSTVPAALGVVGGKTLTLSTSASGPNLSFQWSRNGSPLANGPNPANHSSIVAGATAARLTLTSAVAADAGSYACLVVMPDPQHPATPLTLASGTFTVSLTVAPVLNAFSPGSWIVSGTVTDVVTAQNSPTAFAVTGQPAGVTLDAGGRFQGRPAVAITAPTTYHLTVTASNAAGTSPPLKVDVTVLPLSPYLQGTFNGLVDRHDALNGGYGGTIGLSVLSSGVFSGKLTLGGLSYSFPAQQLTASDADTGTATVVISRKAPLHNLTLVMSIYSVEGLLATVTDGIIATPVQVQGWRNAWNPAINKDVLIASYNCALVLDPGSASTDVKPGNIVYPQGTGFGTLTVTPAGIFTWSGKMADGTAATASSTMGGAGEVPLHCMLCSNTGSLHGWVQVGMITPEVNSLVPLDWMKSPQAAATLNYKNGIPLHKLSVVGAPYIKPTALTPLVLGLPAAAAGQFNARLLFSEGGLAALTYDGPPAVSIEAAAHAGDLAGNGGKCRITGTATTSSVVLPSPNPASLVLNIAPATGTFSGSFVLHGDQDPSKSTPSLVNRTAAFSGLLITRGGNTPFTMGVGYFLLPELQPYPGAPVTASPLLSGSISIQQSP